MLKFGEGFDKIEATTGLEFKTPPCKGYAVRIVKVLLEKSKGKGTPMVRFEMDIASGEFVGAWEKFPKRLYQTYGTDASKGMLKGVFNTIIAENKALFPEEDIFASGDFDEQRLVGCVVGATTEWNRGYLNIRNIVSLARAEQQEEIPKPQSEPVDTSFAFGSNEKDSVQDGVF